MRERAEIQEMLWRKVTIIARAVEIRADAPQYRESHLTWKRNRVSVWNNLIHWRDNAVRRSFLTKAGTGC
jgi:hypothetical protein